MNRLKREHVRCAQDRQPKQNKNISKEEKNS